MDIRKTTVHMEDIEKESDCFIDILHRSRILTVDQMLQERNTHEKENTPVIVNIVSL